jgi:hypothetical protein
MPRKSKAPFRRPSYFFLLSFYFAEYHRRPMDNIGYLCSRTVMGKVFLVCAVCWLLGCGAKKAATEDTTSADAITTPATVEQATRILDLSTLPLMDGAKPPGSRQMANLSYAATGDVKKAFEFHRKALIAQGWKEMPNSSVTDQSASATFSRNGFVVSLGIFPNDKAGGVSVTLQNHGNVKLGKVPVPPGTKPVYVGDSTAMYSTDAAVPATADACRNLLLAQGWVLYGDAGDSAIFKQNAILLTATVSSAPAQGGKTMIQYSSELISADIPAPPGVEDLRYVDEPPELVFETRESQDAIADFYRKALATKGWQSTLDHTVAVDETPTMIFRNPAKEMLTLSFAAPYGGKQPVSVRFQSAAEIAERDRKIKEQAPALRAAAEKKAAEEAAEAAQLAEKNKVPKVAVTLPADAKDVKQSNDSIMFTVGKGKAKAAVEFLRAQFRDAGWKENFASLVGMSGAASFSKEDGQSVSLTYTDTPISPSEVSLSGFRVELEAAK